MRVIPSPGARPPGSQSTVGANPCGRPPRSGAARAEATRSMSGGGAHPLQTRLVPPSPTTPLLPSHSDAPRGIWGWEESGSLPRAEGPLVLSLVEVRAGGGPHLANPSLPPSPITPYPSPIPMPREESQAPIEIPRPILPLNQFIFVPGVGPLTLRPLEEPAPAKAGGRAEGLAPPIRHLSLRPATPLTVIPMPREESRICPLTPFISSPFPLPSTELEAEVGAKAPTSASVLLSPSPLKALRERGIKGVRVPLWGRGASPQTAHLHYLNPRAILLPRPPTSHLGAHHNAGSKESHEPHKPTQAPSQPSSLPPPGHRHAPTSRLLSLSTPRPAPQHPLQALPKGPASRPSQRSITAPPPARKVPGQITARPYSRAIARCAPH